MELISQILLTSFFVLLLDFIWIGLIANSMYKANILATQRSPMKVRLSGAIVSYALLIFGIIYFGVLSNNPLRDGALSGLVAYGLYNAVNYATLSNYSLKVSIIDTMWGTFLCGFVSFVVHTLV